ncbi:MAG: Stp1/IreP family PP2C-type Ser/Thr phosphatase [Anaerolineae bacterium]
MKCPKCEAQNRTGALFCAACGSRLPEKEAIEIQEPEVVEQARVDNVAPMPADREQPAVAEAVVAEEEGDESAEPDGEPAEAVEARDVIEETAEVVDEESAAALEADDELEGGLTPLPAGTLLADRYEIVERVSGDEAGNLYSALDLARCVACGFDANAPGDEYCAECGAMLDTPPACQIREQLQTEEPDAVARFNRDGRIYVVLASEDGQEPAELAPSPRIRFRWGARTDTGLVREHNEDYVDVRVYAEQDGPALGLFVVADGVGGQAAGEVASRLATQVIWDVIRDTVWLPALEGEPVLPETMEVRIAQAVQSANQAVYRQRVEEGTDMGTTVTLALLRDTIAAIANVGDSRTYRWNADGLQQLTVDHSLVQSLIEAGQLEPDEVYTHPHRNIIHRSIGDRPRVEIDTFVCELKPGDRLVLCSDGLWEMARDEGIEEILLLEPDPQAACDALVDRANLAGGADNISVVIVETEV